MEPALPPASSNCEFWAALTSTTICSTLFFLLYNLVQRAALPPTPPLAQVKPPAIMPAWRGERLKEFLAACDSCSGGVGGAKDHYWPRRKGCQACAEMGRKVSWPPGGAVLPTS